MKKKVLFLCTHNSARSQMAEGLLRAWYGDRYEAFSAGTHPSAVNPYAIQVMAEIGIDISAHHSKNVDIFLGMKFDYVVTVCNQAKEKCPFFRGDGKHVHRDFEDPSQFTGGDDQKLAVFRQVRDIIKGWIEKTFGEEDKTPILSRYFARTKRVNWCMNPYGHSFHREGMA